MSQPNARVSAEDALSVVVDALSMMAWSETPPVWQLGDPLLGRLGEAALEHFARGDRVRAAALARQVRADTRHFVAGIHAQLRREQSTVARTSQKSTFPPEHTFW